LLPSVNGIVSYLRQEAPPPGTITAATSPERQRLARLQLTQPLFRGFREYAGLRQTRALIGAQNEDYFGARVQLFKDVTQNFYTIISVERDLVNLNEEIEQNMKREAELRTRARIGRSRVSEVLTVQSTISTLRAQVEQLQGQRRAAREAFAFLSGLAAETALRDTEAVPAALEPLDIYLGDLPARPDVKASRQRFRAADENVAVARGAHLPSVDLNGNYYFDRPGTLADVSWDIQIALTLPIYAGGSLQSKVREAISQRTQAELSVSQVSRQAEQEIRSTYESVVYDQSQLAALEFATEAARKNYEAQLRDYRLGLVTNLEVLQALTAYQENQRALDRARYTAKTDYLKLQAAAVRRPSLPERNQP
jgi:outer membrane protein